MPRYWPHRTRVFRTWDGLWIWKCGICGRFGYRREYPSQEAAFAKAFKHTSVGGYFSE